MSHKKIFVVRARVSDQTKAAVGELAEQREENEAVIVREAIAFYLSAIVTNNPRQTVRALLAQHEGRDGSPDE